jgi:uncharacterized membrane protein YkoI
MSRFLLPLLLLVPLWGGAVAADSDQERAKAALERGEIRPLDQVLAAARKAVPGDVVAVELKRKRNIWLYELKILTAAGKRREVKIDAGSLAILEEEDDDDD